MKYLIALTLLLPALLLRAQTPSVEFGLFPPKGDSGLLAAAQNKPWTWTVQLAGEKIHFRQAKNERKFSLSNRTALRQFLAAEKKKWNDSLSLVLDLRFDGTSPNEIHLLQELAQPGTARILFTAATWDAARALWEEAQKGPPSSVEIGTPRTVTTTSWSQPSAGEVWFTLQFNESAQVWHWTQEKDIPGGAPVEVKKELSVLKELIATRKQAATAANKKLVVVIRGDARASYNDFQVILQALQANEIYQYKLVTDAETKTQ